MDKFEPFPHFATSALHVGQEPEQWKSRAVIPPISMSTTFKQFEPAKFAVGQIYSLLSLPSTSRPMTGYVIVAYPVLNVQFLIDQGRPIEN